MITLELPSPPSTNDLHMRGQRGVHVRRDVKAWKREAGLIMIADRAAGRARPLPAGWYTTHVVIPLTDPADADNRLKSLYDLLAEVRLTPDDAWHWGGTFGRSPHLPRGRLQVRAWALGPDSVDAHAAWMAAVRVSLPGVSA